VPDVVAFRADTNATVRMAMRQAAMALRTMPVVASGRCGTDTADAPATMRTVRNGREYVTICTDRIEYQARRGAEHAAQAAKLHRAAINQALAGMRAARVAMARDMRVHGEAREEALQSMQEAIDEMEQECEDAKSTDC
jgi:hypothetical protein